MKIKNVLSALVILFVNTIAFSQTPTDITLEIEGGAATTICRGTRIQINATITPPDDNYYYNWTNTTTGQNYNPWPVGQGGSGQGDAHSFILLTDLEQSSTIQLQVNGVNQTIDIVVVDAPNPGTDGSLLLCNQAGTIDLFTLLQGTPNAGGTWNPPLSGGNGNFVVGTDAPGEYVYTVNGNAPCPDAEARVTVRECFDLDFDNDGVPNDIDLDDDNDGILDAVENAVCTAGTLSETRPIVDIDFGQGNVSTTDPNVLGHQRSPIWPDDGFYNVGTSTFFGTSDNFEPTFVMTNANPIPNSDGSGDVDGRYLAINVNGGANQPIYQIDNIPIQLGTDYNFRIDIAGLCDVNCQNIPMLDLELIDQNLPAGSPPIFATTSGALGVANDDVWRTLLLNFTADRTTFLTLLITNQQPIGSNGNDLGIDNIRFAQLECDFDLDEIPNYLDLDSDNDGIYDIVEAGNPAVIDANNDGIADGPVGPNGVPLSAGAGTTPVNSDGAEFADYLDIDADNDGIQDNIEGQGTFTYIAPGGNDQDRNGVDDVYDVAGNPVTPEDTDTDGTPDYLDLNSDDDCLSDNVEAYDLNQDGVADILPAGADTDGDGMDNNYDTVVLDAATSVTNPSDGGEVPTDLPDNHNPGDDVDFRDEFEEIFEEIELDFCSGLTDSINLYDELVLAAIPGGVWTGPSVLTGGELGTFDPTVNTAGVYTYTLPLIGNCPERKAEVTITLGTDPDTGTDGTLDLCETDNAVDLFDSLGGTPNPGGEWTPPLASGTGVFDPTVDPAGTYVYTIAFPGCSASSTDVVVTVNAIPDAGEDGTLDICESGTAVDLFTLLQGTPEVGGTWAPILTSGTGVFDPTMDTAGTYTYTVAGVVPCPDNSADVVVTLIDNPDAGIDGTTVLCENGNTVDLFTILGGTPNVGGTWTPALASGTGVFDPTVDTAGTYTYATSIVGCVDDTSEVVVNINTIPDAGEDGNLDICSLGNPVDLFTLLQGTPEVGGTWTPALTSGTGVYDPAVDADGTYTYTVAGVAPCPDNTADVVVNLINNPDAGIDGATVLCNTSNSVDLFTLLGGTPNVGGTWTPALASGTGTFDPAVDTAGTYTYTVAVVGCDDDTSEVVVDINNAPDAGEDSNLDICELGTAVDLFTLIQGTPEAGGTWIPVLASGTGVFDPAVDAGGTYTYTVTGIAPCANDTSQIIVNLIDNPDAGLDSAITLCDSGNAVDLYTLLGGTPDLGGAWTPMLTSGTGIFDPSVDPQGIYTYTVSVIGCDDDTSEVLVGVNQTPNAGTDGTIDVCESDNTLDLFTVLGDGPDPSGTWTPPLASGTGVFDPAIDAAGTYTYTINGPASCPDDSADVIVNVIGAPNAGIDGAIALCDDNNAINLFDSLNGMPDLGGIWTPTLASGTGIFDPSIDAPGAYTYTINSTACGIDSSEATVTVSVSVNAGEDATLSTCNTGSAVNLFDLIGGTPNVGGTWTPPLNSGTGVFDPTVDAAGTYTYTVTAVAPCLDDTSQVVVAFDNTLTLIQPANLRQCDDGNDSVEAFDLDQQTSIIIADNLDYEVSYHVSQPDADNGVNPLNSPYNNIANPQTIYTRVREMSTGCVDTSINFDIELEDGIVANPDTYELCDDNMEFDGNPANDVVVFDLPSRNPIVLGPTQEPGNFTVSYHLTQQDADNGVNPLPDSYENITNTQTIFVRVENNANSCFATAEVVLQVNPLPSFTLLDQYTICIGANGSEVVPPPVIDTDLNNANYSFEWYLNDILIAGQTNSSIIPAEVGNYSVIVTDNATGCASEGVNTTVVESAPPILTAEQISLTFVEDNTILATATNGGTVGSLYEFKLDDGPWVVNIPNDNTYTFEDVSAGEHIITARDINGCGESSVTILVIDYIPYFTPNSDGYHDTWNIIGIENQPDAVIYIFNRYGKLLKQLSPLGNGWDGTYNNEILPTSDYWFTVDYREPSTDERKKFKAHFTLKR